MSNLYTRADYDRDMEALDHAEQEISKRCAIERGQPGHIDGFAALKLQRSIDTQRVRLKGKLFGTILRLKDRDSRDGSRNLGRGASVRNIEREDMRFDAQ